MSELKQKPNMNPKKNPMPTQDPKVRARNFKEVALGYTMDIAKDEAARCLNCKEITFVCTLLQYYYTRERVTEETINTTSEENKTPLKNQVNAVIKDKMWWVIIVFYLVDRKSVV